MFKFCGFLNMWRWICLRLKHVEELPCPFQILRLVTVMKKLTAKQKTQINNLISEGILPYIDEKVSDYNGILQSASLDYLIERLKHLQEL